MLLFWHIEKVKYNNFHSFTVFHSFETHEKYYSRICVHVRTGFIFFPKRALPFKPQFHIMVKLIQTIRWELADKLFEFDHFVRLVLKGWHELWTIRCINLVFFWRMLHLFTRWVVKKLQGPCMYLVSLGLILLLDKIWRNQILKYEESFTLPCSRFQEFYFQQQMTNIFCN